MLAAELTMRVVVASSKGMLEEERGHLTVARSSCGSGAAARGLANHRVSRSLSKLRQRGKNSLDSVHLLKESKLGDHNKRFNILLT